MTRPGVVVVTGATGYLGPSVLRAVAAAGHDAAGLGSSALDVTDPTAVDEAFGALRPVAVVHLAAVNPGRGDPAAMDAVNHHGAAAVATVCAERAIRLVHVSTDVVLAGDPTQAPYPDTSRSAPRNPYGASKAAGETAVAQSCPGAAIVRTSLIYGLDVPDHATAGMAARLAGGQPVTLFRDVWRQPVEAGDLGHGLVALALDHPEVAGTLNLAGDEGVTRESFGRRLLEYWDIPGRERVSAAPVTDPSVPVDLRLRFEAAERLGLRRRGLGQVLAEAASGNPRRGRHGR